VFRIFIVLANTNRPTQLTMTVTELNSKHKLRLRADTKISMVLGLLFSIDVILVGSISSLMFIFSKQPSKGFITIGILTFHDKENFSKKLDNE
jgi:hypothetical protein